MRMFLLVPVSLLLTAVTTASAPRVQSPASAAGSTTDIAVEVAARILRADYEGDRAALARLGDELPPAAGDARLASRILYWRGFALWRRVINGFNESVAAAEQQRDVRAAMAHFDEALQRDPAFADAKIGKLSCLQLLLPLNMGDAEMLKKVAGQYFALLAELDAEAPENPRLHWVRGPSEWYAPPGTPPERIAARQATALASYERGLRLVRAGKGAAHGPLDPSWGEPELLMSLAWSRLNQTQPDVAAAEAHAAEALKLVPHWHYVRDILMPQIRQARAPR